MEDLVVWLRQQLAEDERVAKAATEGPWQVASNGEVKTVALYGTRGYERPVWVTSDSEGLSASVDEEDAEHIARHDPARVLREVEAKRLILDLLGDRQRQAEENSRKFVEAMRSPRGGPADDLLPGIKTHGWTLGGRVEALEEVMKLLALPYSDRPGYREEWKP